LKKFISEPQPPPSGIEIPMEGKAKERREVGEGDDTVVVEDTSDDDDEDEETLQDRFQLRSRFSRPGLPHVPLVQDPPASLEASLAAPPRKPRNPARKRVTKKLKVSETTPQEVSCLEQSSRVLVVRVRLLTSSLVCRRCRQRSPSKRATRACGTQWGSQLEVVVQPPLLRRSWHSWSASPLLHKGARDPWPPPLKRWWPQERRAAAAVEEAVATGALEEAPAEGGLVDIASILGAPAVTIVRSNLQVPYPCE
jgi:hypothetical protein